ncbi:MAG TPA: hypothetical protein VEQ10_01855 [Vicinamibacteria bacterium]|nr:hypothetical protein [Vicinamibacteria bacterium]
MRLPARRSLALVLALALVLPHAALAQQAATPPTPAPEPAPQPEPPATISAASLASHWEGWARLQNDWPGLPCRYEGSPDAVSVNLELTNDGGRLQGSVAIDLPAEQASACPPLRKRYSIDEVSTGPGTVSFTDSGGNEWTLSARRSGTVLQGMLAWREGGLDQPLSEGFAGKGGVRPLARLSGEVRVHRPAAPEAAGGESTAAAAPAAAPAPGKSGGGHKVANVAAIIGVNLVGLGALYAVNKYGKGSSGTGTVSCSARYCIVGAPNAPCFCENELITSGASCGLTSNGVPLGQPCDNLKPGHPCQAGYSCNTTGGPGVCEDRFGRCVF